MTIYQIYSYLIFFRLVRRSCLQHTRFEKVYSGDIRDSGLEVDAGVHCSPLQEARPVEAGHHKNDPGVDGVPRENPRYEDQARAH